MTTTKAKTNSSTPATPLGTLEHIDPNTLDIGHNVRDHVELDPEFTASITEHGVLVPLTAIRTADGTITVREGQCRTLAARAAGLATVPVYITDDTAADDTSRTVQRVTHQITLNDKRKGLTEAQRAKGIQELLIAGLTPTKVAKALTVPKAVVEAAAAAVESSSALEAMDNSQLTIEQAAALIEFEDDPDAIAYLVKAQSAGDFEFRVAERRQQAATAAARAQFEATYIEAGYTMLPSLPDWRDSESLYEYRLAALCTTEGDAADAELPAINPALWAVFVEEMPVYTDTRTGEEVHEHDVDWDVDASDSNAEPEDGYIHPRFIEQTARFEPAYYCTDLAAAGLTTWRQRNRNRNAQGSDTTGEDAENRKEAERREKRKTVALNKLGVAAAQVRQAWVKDKLLTRKTPPKGAAIFIATQFSAHPSLLAGHRADDTAAAMLGSESVSKSVKALPPTGDGRATVILLGLLLGALEAETPKDAWRRSYTTYSKDYLTFLAANGYELSDIEKVITKAMKADKLYDKLVSDQTTTEAVA
ncbi:ParB/RepB/Spo0J family partition protein [Mycolicibacterium llatzerense]|uniref:ParB/RepB/Spo0J family partition protein n=1 Tax=Mycolicibacterium llatzerense TaxID=280871 RepID=UPI0008DC85BE|nr:ParB N-terminal domain-containing protein [Mycolicibacterium llatzerense]